MTRFGCAIVSAMAWLFATCGGGNDAAEASDAVAPEVREVAEVADAASEADASVPALPRLRAEGTAIVTDDGAPVVLRGVALGGWMFHETWITQVEMPVHARLQKAADAAGLGAEVRGAIAAVGPLRFPGTGSDLYGLEEVPWRAAIREHLAAQEPAEVDALFAALDAAPSVYDDADLGLRQVLERRFGVEGRDDLLDVFQGAWLQQADLTWIALQGFTFVRVPIGYRSLLAVPDGAGLPELTWNERALARLDALLDQCARAGLYAVIDLQESPGGHNTYSGEAHLYDTPAAQDLTVAYWEFLVDRFGRHPAVGMWSLLAEPYGAPDAAARDAMYDKLVKAVRARGDEHLCVIHDGFLGMGTLPVASDLGWTNVVYSTHQFEWDFKSVPAYEAFLTLLTSPYTKAQAEQGVPWYIGSFSTLWDEPWATEAAGKMVTWYEEHGWSWSLWTYKRLEDPVENTLLDTAWGLKEGLAPADRPDLYADDLATLKAKLAGYATVGAVQNQGLLDALFLR